MSDLAQIRAELEQMRRGDAPPPGQVWYREARPGTVDAAKRDLAEHYVQVSAEQLGIPSSSVRWFMEVPTSAVPELKGMGFNVFAQSPCWGWADRDHKNEIWLNVDQKLADLGGTTAHEVAHAWQFRRRWEWKGLDVYAPTLDRAELEREADAMAERALVWHRDWCPSPLCDLLELALRGAVV